jgi:hypothetical protein
MEAEQKNTLFFLDVLVSRMTNSPLGHTVYRKTVHKDLYLHVMSEHHLSQKRALLTLIQWAKPHAMMTDAHGNQPPEEGP